MATMREDEGTLSSRDKVLNAITSITEAKHQASRRAIADFTGLTMTVVDDHIKNLKTDGLIRVVVAGVFEPIDQTPDRPVWGGVMPNGRYKVEVGATILDLSFGEARALAMLTGGFGFMLGGR